MFIYDINYKFKIFIVKNQNEKKKCLI